jgi:O-antigen/teichoic acid export membrane protein
MKSRPLSQTALSAAKWMTGSSYVSFAASFIGSIFATRAMGPEAYGVYSYLVWLISLAVSLSTGFLNLTMIRFVAEAEGAGRHEEAAAMVARLRRWCWGTMTVAVLALLGVTQFPGIYPAHVAESIYLYTGFVAACVVFRAIFSFDASASKGYTVFYTEAIASAMTGLLAAGGGAILMLLDQKLPAFLILFAVTSALQMVVGKVVMKRFGVAEAAEAAPLNPEAHGKIMSAMRWNATFTVVNMLSTKSVDTYLLGLQSLTAYIGYYNIAASMTKSGLDLLTSGFSSMLLPMIARAGGEGGKEKIQEIFSLSVKFYQTVGILVACGAWIAAVPAVTALYGPAYLEVVPALKVMALTGGLILPHASFSAVFLATDNQRARTAFVFLSSAISVLTSLAFIPSRGYEGAMLSVFFGNVTTYAMVAVLAHKWLGIRFPLRSVLLQWVSALVPMALITFFLPIGHSVPLALLGELLFFVSFVFIALNLKAWGEAETEMMRNTHPKVRAFIDFFLLRPGAA